MLLSAPPSHPYEAAPISHSLHPHRLCSPVLVLSTCCPGQATLRRALTPPCRRPLPHQTPAMPSPPCTSSSALPTFRSSTRSRRLPPGQAPTIPPTSSTIVRMRCTRGGLAPRSMPSTLPPPPLLPQAPAPAPAPALILPPTSPSLLVLKATQPPPPHPPPAPHPTPHPAPPSRLPSRHSRRSLQPAAAAPHPYPS